MTSREEFERFLLKFDSTLLGGLAICLSQVRGKSSRPGLYTRRLIDMAQAANPLAGSSLNAPPIDIVTITAADTLQFAEVSLRAAAESSENRVNALYAIVPHDLVDDAKSLIPSAEIVSELDVLPQRILNALEHFRAIGRRHWVLCQVLGMYFARQSTQAATLIVDADTFILGGRVWVDRSGRQSLSVATDYHQPYEDHCVSLYGQRRRHHGLSYISHYMLMQPGVLREIFPNDRGFISWILAGNPDEPSAVGDYHTYGRWLVDHHPDKVAITRWRNKPFVWDLPPGVETGEAIRILKELFPEFHSVSSHRWMEK